MWKWYNTAISRSSRVLLRAKIKSARAAAAVFLTYYMRVDRARDVPNAHLDRANGTAAWNSYFHNGCK